MTWKRSHLAALVCTAAVGAAALAVGVMRTRERSAGPAGSSSSGASDARTVDRTIEMQFSDKPVPMPAFSVTTLDGKTLSPADWRGKVVLINFWATWCSPCRSEIPEFVKMQDRYRDHLAIVGLSVDEGSVDGVREFVRELGVNYPVAVVGEEVQQAFGGMFGLPTSFVVDKTGQIVYRHIGLVSTAVYQQEVRALAGLPGQEGHEVALADRALQ